jgi:RNA polymerase sigma-70 factor (ECF subfamily)
MVQLSDEQLGDALRRSEAGALDEAARRFWAPIRRFCWSYLRDDQRAEDVAQETFAKLQDPQGLPAGPLKPWLYRLARNRCLDLVRRQDRSPTDHGRMRTGFDAPAQTGGPVTRTARNERDERIRAALDNLPEDYRAVLVMKYYEGLSREEIAAALDVSEQTVKGRLVRGAEYLREELRKIAGTLG